MQPRIPKHVAIIMDGNGRWAQARGHRREFGHIRGSSRVKEIVRAADDMGIKALTLYAFSTENWLRPDQELRVLWSLLIKYLKKEIDELDRNNVRFHVIGELERLRPDVQKAVREAMARLSKNTGLQLTFAVSYGSRAELIRASQLFAADCVHGRRKPADMNESLMRDYLYTAALGELSDVDLVIRTSGEKRVSNFLLWQSAYAEYVFFELCWPDFRREHFAQALKEFAGRDRRFGKTVSSSLEQPA